MNLTKVLFFTIFSFIILYLILRDWINRYVIKKILSSSIILSDYRFFQKQKKDIQMLFLGSCEFRSGIDTKAFKFNLFNFSVPLISFVEQYYFLKHHIPEMPRLKVLILSVGDNSFCSYASTGINFPIMFNRFIDYRELLKVSDPKMKFKLLWFKWIYSSNLGSIRYGRKFFVNKAKRYIFYYTRKFSIRNIKRFVKKKSLKIKTNIKKHTSLRGGGAYIDKNQGMNDKIREGKKEGAALVKQMPVQAKLTKDRKTFANAEDGFEGAKEHFSKPVFDSRGLIYFEKILNLCKDKNITVVTVSMPRSKYFLEFSKEYVTEEEFLKNTVENPRYKNLIFKHFNYLNTYRDRDDFFVPDGAELNTEGRRAFSVCLAKDLSDIMTF